MVAEAADPFSLSLSLIVLKVCLLVISEGE